MSPSSSTGPTLMPKPIPSWRNGTAACVLGAGVLLLATASAAEASMLLKVEQVGADVVITGSGSIDTSGLTAGSTSDTFTNLLTDTQLFAGPAAFSNGSIRFWSGLSGPAFLGSDSNVLELPDDSISSSFGDLFGIQSDSIGNGAGIPLLVLPQTYVSGSSLSGTSRYSNRTLSELGLTPGTLTWSVGSGASLQTVQITTAVPAPLGFASVAVVFSSIRRLQRNTQFLKQSARQPSKRA